MNASKRLVVRRVAIVTLLAAAACSRQPEASPSSVPESRAGESSLTESRRDWLEITVDADPGWDAALVAKQAGLEIETCRDVIEQRLGLQQKTDPPVLKVRFVHGRTAFDAASVDSQASDLLLVWGDFAFIQSKGGRLFFTRDAEVRERVYLASLALLLFRYQFPRVGLADSLAIWLSGVALNRLQKVPSGEGGRVREEIRLVSGDAGPLLEACRWASMPMFPRADLAWDRAGTGRFSDVISERRERTQCWFLVYFLATFDAGEDKHVKFSGVSRYDADLRRLAAARDRTGCASVCEALSNDAALVADLVAYQDFVNRKVGLGHVRNGVLVTWSEYANSLGKKSGQPDDDQLFYR